ncbi:MAG: hypothetical protein NT002_11475 [candidate division Zixibacteria bacterium]|nr:hypothetical protein [candidate division Zixibacteria bacterium]
MIRLTPNAIASSRQAALWLMIALLLSLVLGCGNKGKTDLSGKVVAPPAIGNWKLQNASETYDRRTIFDYIDGAGEVYLAYDFRRVEVHHYAGQNKPDITLEIYDMGSAENAYGIFSYTRENDSTGIGQGYDYLGSLFCFWQNNYFVSITTVEETPDTKEGLYGLARQISNQLPKGGEKPRLLKLLPLEGLKSSSLLYLHSYPVLNNEYFLSSENILGLDSTTNAVLATYEPDRSILLLIQYRSAEKAESSRKRFSEAYTPSPDQSGFAVRENGRVLMIAREGKYLAIVLEAPSRQTAADYLEKIKALIIQYDR